MRLSIRSMALSMLFFVAILSVAQTGYADDGTTIVPATASANASTAEDTMQSMATYIYNLGGDIGYDLNDTVKSPKSALLVSPPQVLQSLAMGALMTLFGAIPVDSSLLDLALVNFVPSNNANYTSFNALANSTFLSYNAPGSVANQGSGTPVAVTVSPLVDQQAYQKDPVNQFILNLLGTPDATWCMDPSDTKWLNNNSQTIGDCPTYPLYNNKVLNNVIGTTPPTPFLAPNAVAPFMDELNPNTLIAPLMYTTANSAGTTTPPSGNPGLVGATQAQQAANFIRYATGSVIPLSTPSQVDYNKLLMTIYTPSSGRTAQEAAQATLNNYLASVRVYAARNSVAVSNLYYILSKRIPQSQQQNEAVVNGSSQALMEMTMATRRMYDPGAAASGQPQWITMINNASPTTVQKEMAVLLSEINYQLYLNRQQDERILLTNSLLLLQSLSQNQPDASLSNTSNASSNNNSSD